MDNEWKAAAPPVPDPVAMGFGLDDFSSTVPITNSTPDNIGFLVTLEDLTRPGRKDARHPKVRSLG
jgi:hypothetical protein